MLFLHLILYFATLKIMDHPFVRGCGLNAVTDSQKQEKDCQRTEHSTDLKEHSKNV